MEDNLITCGRGVSTFPENCAAAIETVLVAAVELFIDPDPGTAIKSDRVTVLDWVVGPDLVVLDPVREFGICSDRMEVMGSKSSDLAGVMDSDWVAAKDSDRVVAMDSEVEMATDSSQEHSAQVGVDSDQLAAMDSEVAAAMDSDRAAAAVTDWAAAPQR